MRQHGHIAGRAGLGTGVRAALLIALPVLLTAAGIVLWSGRASAVFLDSVSAVLAWCM